MIEPNLVSDVEELVSKVGEVTDEWKEANDKDWPIEPWFRGEGEADKTGRTALLPKLYQGNYPKDAELKLLQEFRMRAPTFVDIPIPQRGHTDQWLFLARHVGLPTRLLDCTEGLLISLHFALYAKKGRKKLGNGEGYIEVDPGAVVWMLDPYGLNKITAKEDKRELSNYFPLTWLSPEIDSTIWLRKLLTPDSRVDRRGVDFSTRFLARLTKSKARYNIGNRNIRAAWEKKKRSESKLPIAIVPTAIHPRITVQRSTFLIWGSDKRSLEQLIERDLLRKFVFSNDGAIERAKDRLRLLGITRSSIFPDLDNLAKDLESLVQFKDDAGQDTANGDQTQSTGGHKPPETRGAAGWADDSSAAEDYG